jgi:rRNA maturation endonuclease Nob1
VLKLGSDYWNTIEMTTFLQYKICKDIYLSPKSSKLNLCDSCGGEISIRRHSKSKNG